MHMFEWEKGDSTLSWEDHPFDGAKVRDNLKQGVLLVFEASLVEVKVLFRYILPEALLTRSTL